MSMYIVVNCYAVTVLGVDVSVICFVFFFQAEDGIRDLVRSRGLGDVYKRQESLPSSLSHSTWPGANSSLSVTIRCFFTTPMGGGCLLYTSDAADERSSVDLGGRRIIKKKKHRI